MAVIDQLDADWQNQIKQTVENLSPDDQLVMDTSRGVI